MAICTATKDPNTGRTTCFEENKIRVFNLSDKEKGKLCLEDTKKIAAYMSNGGKDGGLILQWLVIPFKIACNNSELSDKQEKLYISSIQEFLSLIEVKMSDETIMEIYNNLKPDFLDKQFDPLMENLAIFVENFLHGFSDVYLEYSLCAASYCLEDWNDEYQTKLDKALMAGYDSTFRIEVAADSLI